MKSFFIPEKFAFKTSFIFIAALKPLYRSLLKSKARLHKTANRVTCIDCCDVQIET
jgi:hypothetical protein